MDAAGLVGQIEEQKARQAQFEKMFANQPNKNYLYIGLLLAIGLSVIGVFVTVQANGGISAIMSAMGLK